MTAVGNGVDRPRDIRDNEAVRAFVDIVTDLPGSLREAMEILGEKVPPLALGRVSHLSPRLTTVLEGMHTQALAQRNLGEKIKAFFNPVKDVKRYVKLQLLDQALFGGLSDVQTIAMLCDEAYTCGLEVVDTEPHERSVRRVELEEQDSVKGKEARRILSALINNPAKVARARFVDRSNAQYAAHFDVI